MTEEKIITTNEAIKLAAQLKKEEKKIVLTGGCFDLLHKGHIHYLTNAKKQADILFLMLESDSAIENIKGKSRPINSQKDRAYILSHIIDVDYVILLPRKLSDLEYDKLIFSLKPDIIATTKGDPYISHKMRQAEKADAKLIEVVDVIKNTSTSQLAALLEKEL